MKNIKALIIGIGLMACAAGNSVAFAETNSVADTKLETPLPSANFTVYPTFMHGTNKAWIVANATPGGTLKESVTLENLSDTKQQISLVFKEATGAGNKFMPIEKETYQNLGRWTNLGSTSGTDGSTYTLSPHEKRRVPVEIKVPGSAAQQKYQGIIYAVQQQQQGQNLKVVTRLGVRTYITVTPAFDIQTNTFSNGTYKSGFFMAFSLIGVLGAMLYNGIYILESRKIKTANK
jgi:hypothetical protein